MSTTNIADRQTVVEFSFWEFCQKVQVLIQQGYVFSATNEDFPQAYVGNYTASLLKFKEPTVQEVVVTAQVPTEPAQITNEVPQSKPVSTKGRKPSVK